MSGDPDRKPEIREVNIMILKDPTPTLPDRGHPKTVIGHVCTFLYTPICSVNVVESDWRKDMNQYRLISFT